MSATTDTPAPAPSHGHHPEPPQVVGKRQRQGVLLLIAADAAFLFSMVFTWFYLRGLNTEGSWIPDGVKTISSGPSWIIAGVTIASWAAYAWGERALGSGHVSELTAGVGGALILLLGAVVLQVRQLATLPFGALDGAYPSTVVLFGGSAVIHLVLTAFFALAILNRTRLGLITVENAWHARLVGIWWLWIAISAVVSAFTMSFTTSPNIGG